jgi:hypothetical protein
LLRETEEHAVAPTKKLHVDCTIGIGLSGWPMRAMAEVEVPVKLDPDDWDAVLKYVLDSDGPVLREWDAGTEVLGVKVVQPEANR